MNILNDFNRLAGLDLQCINNFVSHTYAKDAQGKYLFVNDIFMKAVGFSKDSDMLGLTDFDLVCLPEAESKMLRNNDIKIMETKNYQGFVEPITLIDGQKAVAISHKVPLRSRTNKVIGVSGVSLILDRHEFFSQIMKDIPSYIPEVNAKLTPRQMDCLKFLAQGLTAKEIGHNLNISSRTVETHLAVIKNILGCKTRSELISMAFKLS